VRPAVWLLTLGLAACSAADSDPARTQLVTRGVEAYTRAMETEDRDARLAAFAEAQRFFAEASQAGGQPALYVNLGNAGLAGQHLGQAVLAYRRALRLDPDHGQAARNLAHARGLLPDWVPRPESSGALDSFFFWHRTLSRAERSGLAAWAFFLAALLVAWSLRTGQTTPRNLAWLPGIAWLALVGSLVFDPATEARADVVITAGETPARAADSSVAPLLFQAPLPGGTEARLLEERAAWAQIRLANGRDVWVARSSLSRVVPEPQAPPESDGR